ncbi:hypothetical protein KR067_000949, partial [Drosophila pandora]
MCCPAMMCGVGGCSGCAACPLMPPPSCCAQTADGSCPRRPLEKLMPAKKPICCPVQSCALCARDPDQTCRCTCARNKNITEALACLFRVSKYQLISTLFQLAYHESQPLPRFPRDREWNVMENVKAPYTELHDLKIYDSMYDRCGMPINPLDESNIYKILRMMFMGPVLVPEQKAYLMGMLRKLNDRAICPVDLDILLAALEQIQLEELVCGIIDQDARAKRFYSGRHCTELCKLYQKVVATDKNAVIRKRRQAKSKASDKDADGKKKPQRNKPPVNVQVYCTRRPTEPTEDSTGRAESTTPVLRSAASSLRRSSVKKNWPTRFSQVDKQGDRTTPRRESRSSGGSPKRNNPEMPNVGNRMQGGDHGQWS